MKNQEEGKFNILLQELFFLEGKTQTANSPKRYMADAPGFLRVNLVPFHIREMHEHIPLFRYRKNKQNYPKTSKYTVVFFFSTERQHQPRYWVDKYLMPLCFVSFNYKHSSSNSVADFDLHIFDPFQNWRRKCRTSVELKLSF